MEKTSIEQLESMLKIQRDDFTKSGIPSVDVRIERLNKGLRLLLDNRDAIVEAVSEDFGHRSAEVTLFADIVASVNAFKDAIKHVKKWMKADKRGLRFPLGLLGAKAEVRYHPKGVVGIIAPWNFPIGMMFIPLSNALAAGNRALIKPSEHTPRTSALIERLVAETFAETEVRVITGGPEVGAAFSSQAFDHIIFTGPTFVGKLVMEAAAKNLTPVTLELGGKSPVFVSKTADLKMVAERVAFGKFMNAGQICLAPDYLFIDEARRDEFVDVFIKTAERMYPTMLSNDDYTSIITPIHRERLESWLEDARTKGADVRMINPAGEDFAGQNKTNKMPGALILDATEDMKVLQSEIFGPVMPVKSYKGVEEAIDYINAKPRPLALYYFGNDKAEEDKLLNHTLSGGVTINSVVMHGAHDTVPFGGVGASGIGNYHGFDGFKTFSHGRTVLRHPKLSIERLIGLIPPYGKKIQSTIKMDLKG